VEDRRIDRLDWSRHRRSGQRYLRLGDLAAEFHFCGKIHQLPHDGIPLTEQRERDLFFECTGRSKLPTKPAHRLFILAGRPAGKDRFKSAVVTWRAALCMNWRRLQSAGEGAVAILLGADKKQTVILRKYCEGLLQAPLLSREVMRRTGDVIEFRNGSSLEIATNNVSLVRGRSAIAVLGSECAHWKTDEHAASSDEEVVAAAVPSMAMCPDGCLLMLGSSVYRKRGYMYRKFKELHGNNDSDDICWFAPSAVMNPQLRQSVIDRALAEDAPKASAEFRNIWREDLSDFVPLDVLEACTDAGVHERPPQPNVQYVAYCDPALGTGKDSFTVAVAHCEGDDKVVLDCVRERKPRFVPAVVVAEFAEVLSRYGVHECWGDFMPTSGPAIAVRSGRHRTTHLRIICERCRCCWPGGRGYSTTRPCVSN
jgi:hypothetical protein